MWGYLGKCSRAAGAGRRGDYKHQSAAGGRKRKRSRNRKSSAARGTELRRHLPHTGASPLPKASAGREGSPFPLPSPISGLRALGDAAPALAPSADL